MCRYDNSPVGNLKRYAAGDSSRARIIEEDLEGAFVEEDIEEETDEEEDLDQDLDREVAGKHCGS